jgi:hypothetical protein
MIETLHKVLVDSSARNKKAVEANLVNNSDASIPWFD